MPLFAWSLIALATAAVVRAIAAVLISRIESRAEVDMVRAAAGQPVDINIIRNSDRRITTPNRVWPKKPLFGDGSDKEIPISSSSS